MKTFGPKRWGPSLNDPEMQHEGAPAGARCRWCDELIGPEDYGLFIPHQGEIVTEYPYHEECQLRSIIGSVGHLMKKCSCYHGLRVHEEDPPGMSRRMAAYAAVRMWRRQQKALEFAEAAKSKDVPN